MLLVECERRDSNPHGLPHRILSPARLPVPPLSRIRGRTSPCLASAVREVRPRKHSLARLRAVELAVVRCARVHVRSLPRPVPAGSRNRRSAAYPPNGGRSPQHPMSDDWTTAPSRDAGSRRAGDLSVVRAARPRGIRFIRGRSPHGVRVPTVRRARVGCRRVTPRRRAAGQNGRIRTLVLRVCPPAVLQFHVRNQVLVDGTAAGCVAVDGASRRHAERLQPRRPRVAARFV